MSCCIWRPFTRATPPRVRALNRSLYPSLEPIHTRASHVRHARTHTGEVVGVRGGRTVSQKPDSESPPPPPPPCELTPPRGTKGGEGDAFPVAVEHHCLAMFSDRNPDWLEIPRTATGDSWSQATPRTPTPGPPLPIEPSYYLVVVRHTTKATPLLGQPISPRWHDARSTTSTLTGRNFIPPSDPPPLPPRR